MEIDSLEIALQYLRYFSESSKELQNGRLDTGWTVYLSLLVIIPGALMTQNKKLPASALKTTKAVMIALSLLGIAFIWIGQDGNNKNRMKYAAADQKIEEILIKIGGIEINERGKYAEEFPTDCKSEIGRWITTIVMSGAIITLLLGSYFAIGGIQAAKES